MIYCRVRRNQKLNTEKSEANRESVRTKILERSSLLAESSISRNLFLKSRSESAWNREGPLIQIFKSLYNTSSLQQFNKKYYLSASKFFMSLLVSAPTQFEIFGSINGSAYNIFPFSSLLFIRAPVATVQINFISFPTF